MSTPLAAMRRIIGRTAARPAAAPAPAGEGAAEATPVAIAENDPIIAFFQSATGPVDIAGLELDSPALEELRAAGVRTVVPLVSQGELIGLLNLGPRLSEQEYSADDRKLLENLATQAAPALQVAQLVRRQEAEARSRARIEQELRVAQLIQQNFLPKELPELPGWHVAAYYQPAREVGGDFYDFIDLPDGRVGVVVGDVTDKGVPAAMMMAATRSVLRAAGQRIVSPGEVLERVNDLLCPDMPAKMFVTCLYAVLDPATGRVRFANAGHNVPYVRAADGVRELHARGMPLGLLPGMRYEENEAEIEAGEGILFHSDGLAEAHGPDREMFGLPRLMALVGEPRESEDLIDVLLSDLAAFTGPGWEQEDDITLVSIRRSVGAAVLRTAAAGGGAREHPGSPEGNGRVLGEFEVPSEAGNERRALALVEDAVRELALPPERLERLKTAVAEATMNAMEHGNRYDAELPVSLRVLASDADVRVRITDRGGGRDVPEPETPDLDAKLAGLQRPRGWGLFLIQNMVDGMEVTSDEEHHTVELVLRREGAEDGSDAG